MGSGFCAAVVVFAVVVVVVAVVFAAVVVVAAAAVVVPVLGLTDLSSWPGEWRILKPTLLVGGVVMIPRLW